MKYNGFNLRQYFAEMKSFKCCPTIVCTQRKLAVLVFETPRDCLIHRSACLLVFTVIYSHILCDSLYTKEVM